MTPRGFPVYGVLEAALSLSRDRVIEKTDQTPKRTDLTGDFLGYKLQPGKRTYLLRRREISHESDVRSSGRPSGPAERTERYGMSKMFGQGGGQ
jgi:hypothetical protein